MKSKVESSVIDSESKSSSNTVTPSKFKNQHMANNPKINNHLQQSFNNKKKAVFAAYEKVSFLN